MLLVLIDFEYTRHPFYGSRKIKQYLCGLGRKINRKRVQKLMGILGLACMELGPDTRRRHPQHKDVPIFAQRRAGDPLQLQSGC